jgi:hypothetical protein
MAAIISESYQSRPFTYSKQSGRELIYDIQGTDDETEVQTLLLGAAPAIYLGLQLEEVSADPIGNGIWKGRAKYVRLNDEEYTFDTGGGTQHITQSLETIQGYAAPGYGIADFEGAIGVSDDRVEGCDIIAPKYEFSETHYLDNATVTLSYKLVIFNLTGKVNDATFRGFAAGECLFLGASGSRRGDERWGITFRFSCSPNRTGLSVGPITGIDKEGWQYLWVRYITDEDDTAKSLVQRPSQAYVERVYYSGDFTGLLI